jgi:hypothetical protein
VATEQQSQPDEDLQAKQQIKRLEMKRQLKALKKQRVSSPSSATPE